MNNTKNRLKNIIKKKNKVESNLKDFFDLGNF